MSVCVLIGQRFRWVEKRIWKWGEGHEGKNKKLRVGNVKGKKGISYISLGLRRKGNYENVRTKKIMNRLSINDKRSDDTASVSN